MNISNISKYEIAMYKLYETSDRAISGAMVRARAYMYDRALSTALGEAFGRAAASALMRATLAAVCAATSALTGGGIGTGTSS